MINFAPRENPEGLVRRTLCSCFLAVDGTITLRGERVPEAAKAVSSCLASYGFLVGTVEVGKVIFAFVQRNGESSVPVSVPASDVASRICAALGPQQLVA